MGDSCHKRFKSIQISWKHQKTMAMISKIILLGICVHSARPQSEFRFPSQDPKLMQARKHAEYIEGIVKAKMKQIEDHHRDYDQEVRKHFATFKTKQMAKLYGPEKWARVEKEMHADYKRQLHDTEDKILSRMQNQLKTAQEHQSAYRYLE